MSGLSLTFVLVFLISPEFYNRLGEEDSLVEWLSAIFFFAAAVIAGLSYREIKKKNLAQRKIYEVIILILGAGFLFLGLEEISWFQRIIYFQPPAWHEQRFGTEFNLHNMSTNVFENLYYSVSFVFLVLIPYVCEKKDLHCRSDWISFFIPSRFILLTSIMAFALNYDMWNVITIQFSFFITLFILIATTLENNEKEYHSLLCMLTLVFISTQVIFLMLGSRMIRSWDVTEYKEFFIPLCFMIYTCEILLKCKKV